MIALDTNILVRLITKDDPGQLELASALLRTGGPFLVTRTVILEANWVLGRGQYKRSRGQICDDLAWIAALPGLEFEDNLRTLQALRWHRDGMDLGDALLRSAVPEEIPIATLDAVFHSLAGHLGIVLASELVSP